MSTPIQQAEELATILRNLKCDVVIDPATDYYRINSERIGGVYSFISRARRALQRAGIELPRPEASS